MEIITDLRDWLFKSPSSKRSPVDIIIWWEKRRVPYNFIIGVAALGVLLLYFFFIDHARVLQLGEDMLEPMALFAILILWNIAYTFGWIIELFSTKIPQLNGFVSGPILLGLGLIFSILVVAYPAIYWGHYCLFSR